jgi:hypothetical protein
MLIIPFLRCLPFLLLPPFFHLEKEKGGESLHYLTNYFPPTPTCQVLSPLAPGLRQKKIPRAIHFIALRKCFFSTLCS